MLVVKKCPKNETYKECGTNCEETCDEYSTHGIACGAICISGCFCKPGLVRHEKTCIKKEKCPKIKLWLNELENLKKNWIKLSDDLNNFKSSDVKIENSFFRFINN